MKKLLNKKIMLILTILLFVVLLVMIVLFTSENEQNDEKENKEYTVQTTETIAFRGISDYYTKQDIFYNESNGAISNLYVTNQQEVTLNTPLFQYYDDSLEMEIQSLLLQQESITREYNVTNTKLNDYKTELEGLDNQADESITFSSKKETLQINIETVQATLEGLSNSLVTNNAQIEHLKNKQYKTIYAEEEGIVYINDDALQNPSLEYMRITPNKSIIRSYVDEFDILNIQEGMVVGINILNSSEKLNGIVTKKGMFPDKDKSVEQAYYEIIITQDTPYIKIGYSVNIEIKPTEVSLPKKVIQKENNKYYVYKKGNQKTEVKGVWKDQQFIVSSDNINNGDILYEND